MVERTEKKEKNHVHAQASSTFESFIRFCCWTKRVSQFFLFFSSSSSSIFHPTINFCRVLFLTTSTRRRVKIFKTVSFFFFFINIYLLFHIVSSSPFFIRRFLNYVLKRIFPLATKKYPYIIKNFPKNRETKIF